MPKNDQLYGKFALDFPDHHKIYPLSDAAFRCLVEAVLWSRKQRTDGLLPRCFALLRWSEETLKELCTNDPENPSLVEVDGGWQLHDFADYQTTSVEIEQRRMARIMAGQKGGKASGAARLKQTRSKPKQGASRLLQHGGSKTNPETETETEITTPPTTTVVGTPHGTAKRATRLPDGWMPDRAVIEAMKHECPHVDLQAAHRVFVDYWQAKPGREGTKLDWDATWRNWIRREAEKTPNGTGPANSQNGQRPHKLRVAAELAAQMAAEEAQPPTPVQELW